MSVAAGPVAATAPPCSLHPSPRGDPLRCARWGARSPHHPLRCTTGPMEGFSEYSRPACPPLPRPRSGPFGLAWRSCRRLTSRRSLVIQLCTTARLAREYRSPATLVAQKQGGENSLKSSKLRSQARLPGAIRLVALPREIVVSGICHSRLIAAAYFDTLSWILVQAFSLQQKPFWSHLRSSLLS
jgi:hypothetical protein